MHPSHFLAAATLLASFNTVLTIPMPASLLNATNSSSTSLSFYHEPSAAGSTAVPSSTADPDSKSLCLQGGVTQIIPDGVTMVRSEESSSALHEDDGTSWILPLGVMALTPALGHGEPTWLLALLAGAWVNVMIPSAMAAGEDTFVTTASVPVSVVNTTALATLPTTSIVHDIGLYTSAAAALSKVAGEPDGRSHVVDGTAVDPPDDKKYWVTHDWGNGAASPTCWVHGALLWAFALGSAFLGMGRPSASLMVILLAGVWLQIGMPKAVAADVSVSLTPGIGPATSMYNASKISSLVNVASYTSTAAAVSKTNAIESEQSCSVDSDRAACPENGGMDDKAGSAAFAVVVIGASSASKLDGSMLWALALGSVTLFSTAGRLTPMSIMALGLVGWASVGTPGAMATDHLVTTTIGLRPLVNTTTMDLTLPAASGDSDAASCVLPSAVAVSTATNANEKRHCADGNADHLSDKKGGYGAPKAGAAPILLLPKSSACNIDSGTLWALAPGALAVLTAVGESKLAWFLALLVVSWADISVPGAMAADMFVSFTPGPGPSGPAFNSTSYTIPPPTSTVSLTSTPTTTTTVTSTPLASGTAKSLASTQEKISSTPWLPSIGSVAALLAVNKLKALALLVLLVGSWTTLGVLRVMGSWTIKGTLITTTRTTTLSTTITTVVTMSAAPYGPSTLIARNPPSLETNGSLASALATPSVLGSATSNTSVTLYRPGAYVSMQSQSVASSRCLILPANGISMPTATLHEANACSWVGDLYDCPLSESSIPVVGSTAAAWAPITHLVIGLLAAAIIVYVSELSAIVMLIPMLLVDLARVAGTTTELIVNVSTIYYSAVLAVALFGVWVAMLDDRHKKSSSSPAE